MSKIIKFMVVLSSILVLSACGTSKKEETEASTTEETKSETGPTSPITNNYLSDLSSEIDQYWFADGAYTGKDITDLGKVTWKQADTNQCFTLLSKDEALFATTDNGNIVNARIYKVGKMNQNGFYPLTQIESVVSETYFNEKVKHKESYKQVDNVKFIHNANEGYLSSTSNFSKKIQYVRFYNLNENLYRENFSDGVKINLHRYSK